MSTVQVILKITDNHGRNLKEEFENARGSIDRNILNVISDASGTYLSQFQPSSYLYWCFIESFGNTGTSQNVEVTLRITNTHGSNIKMRFSHELARITNDNVLQIYHSMNEPKTSHNDSDFKDVIVAEFQYDSYLYWKCVG
jgi:hypothetical protein